MIPSSRVIAWKGAMAGGEALPEEARPLPLTALAGGASQANLTTTRDKIYLVVNTLGEPALTQAKRQKTYEASSPATAATKAFYAWWRSTQKPTGIKVTDASFAESATRAEEQQLQDHLDRMRSRLDKATLQRFDAGRARFEEAWQRVNPEVLEKKLLVRLAALGGKQTQTRNYLVGYERNLNPNLMEVVGPAGGSSSYTPIVVNARAVHMPRDAPLAAGAHLHYLEREMPKS